MHGGGPQNTLGGGWAKTIGGDAGGGSGKGGRTGTFKLKNRNCKLIL